MNVKKMFASLTGVLMLASVTPVSVLGAANYGAELTGAYEYAYSKGITTMSSIENANMYGEITRGQLAKMIANWAQSERNVQADETKVCAFTDANTAEGDLATYLKKACQMGLMGQGIDAFRPNDKVTRGEFGTTLSRALWGDKYNTSETPYYKNHLQALKDAGIMTRIENPNQMEIRGYVMLMLQRSVNTVDSAKCADPVVALACQMGTDACPAVCKTTPAPETNTGVVKAGDLNVSVVDYSAAVKTAPKGIFVANKLRFAASESVSLESLTLKRSGLSTRTDVEKVWLERNGVAVTNAASLGSDGVLVLNFKNGKNVVTADAKTQEFDLVIQFKETATTGNELALELVGATASAKNITVSGTTTTFRIAGYTVVSLKIDDVNNAAVSYQVGKQSDFVIAQFALESDSNKDDRDINVRSLTFRNAGSIDFAATFKNVKVYRDSKVVSNNVEVNGRDITITLDQDVIKANKRALYTVKAEVATLEQVGQTVQLQLRNAKDLIADEADTGFRANIAFDTTWKTTSTGTFAAYTFNGGRVLLETKSGFPRTVEAGVGTNDIVVAQGKITVTEAVELPNIEIAHGANWSTTDVLGANVIKRLVLEIGGTRYTADNNGAGKFVFENIALRSSADVNLLISIDSKATVGSSITLPSTLGTSLMVGEGEYTANSEPLKAADIAGAITVSKVNIKDAKFQLTAKNTTTQSVVVNDTARKTLLDATLSSKDKGVNVNTLTVSLVGTLAAGELVDVFLNVDGQPFSNATLTAANPTYVFNNLGSIEAGKTMPFSLEVSPTIARAKNITLSVQAAGTDFNGNAVSTSTEYSSKLEVKADAGISLTSVVSADRVVEPTVNAVLYEGTLDVTRGSTELTQFGLTASTAGDVLKISNYKLYVDGEFVADNATAPTFAGLTHNLEEGKRTVTVKANVENDTNEVAAATSDHYAYNVTSVSVNGTAYAKTANTYFALGFFKLARVSTVNGTTTVTLENTSPKAIDVVGLSFADATKVLDASVNGQSVNPDMSVSAQSVPAGGKIELTFTAKLDELAKLTGVKYTLTDGNDTYKYELTSANTSVARWADLTAR